MHKYVYGVGCFLHSDLQVFLGNDSRFNVMTHLFLFEKYDDCSVISRQIVCFCIKNDDKIT